MAHGLGKEGPVEGQSLGCQLVDVRRPGVLTTIEWKIVVGAIIRQYDEKIRLTLRLKMKADKKTDYINQCSTKPGA